VTAETFRKFGVVASVSPSGEPIHLRFPYEEGAKCRKISVKQFWSENLKKPQLFGKQLFSPGCAKAITIVEGELDAPSCYQMLGSRYPCVSVRSATSALKDCSEKENRDYLNSFDKIYLCFDSDEPGQKATLEVAKLFDFNKVYHVKLSLKDANDYLNGGREDEFRQIWYNSRRFLPEGVFSTFAEFREIVAEVTPPGFTYPFPTLQEMVDGARPGEILLLTAMEGIGKTEMVRSLLYHWLLTTDERIAAIFLEENKQRQLRGLAGLHLSAPCHTSSCKFTNEEVNQALETLIRNDDRLHLYSHFGSSDPDTILDNIRFLVAACGCKIVLLDHISLMVSGLNDNDERKTLDYISTKLTWLVEDLGFCLVLVSHINDEGRTRGSRNISKVADVWVHLDRDPLAEDAASRNKTKLILKKNRPLGLTGPAGTLVFNPSTFKLKEQLITVPEALV